MKIMLSESQAVKLLKEAYGNQSYIDSLLDKIYSKGISSLTSKERNDLEKMSHGEDIQNDEPQKKDDWQAKEDDYVEREEIREMFMNLLPYKQTINVDGVIWKLTKEVSIDGDYEIIELSDGMDMVIEIEPFTTNETFTVRTPSDSFDVSIKKPIFHKDEVQKFVQKFLQIDIKQVIKYVRKNR